MAREIARFAARLYTTARRFNALFGCAGSEGTDAQRQTSTGLG